MRAVLAVLALGGSVFSTCQGGPVPHGCCKAGDQLNIRLLPREDPTQNNFTERCNRMGGHLVVKGDDVMWCMDVDF